MKKLLFTLVTFFTTFVFSQEKIQIVDSQTKEPIAFATIVFGDGLGGYTNENGYFDFDTKQNFSVSMLGYKSVSVSEEDFKSIIELESQPFEIEEVVISNKKGKQKIVKQKAYWKNANAYDSFVPIIASELAVLIPNEAGQEVVLDKIILPLAINSYRNYVNKKGESNIKAVDELPYTMIRIRFYSNENNKPSQLLYSDEIVLTIPNFIEKRYEIDLEKYSIDIPQNGLFVGIEFMGFADKNQKYYYTPNYVIRILNREKIKTSYGMVICFPIDTKSKEEKTFVRFVNWEKNGQKFPWITLSEDPVMKLNDRKGTSNIGLGYELKVYE